MRRWPCNRQHVRLSVRTKVGAPATHRWHRHRTRRAARWALQAARWSGSLLWRQCRHAPGWQLRPPSPEAPDSVSDKQVEAGSVARAGFKGHTSSVSWNRSTSFSKLRGRRAYLQPCMWSCAFVAHWEHTVCSNRRTQACPPPGTAGRCHSLGSTLAGPAARLLEPLPLTVQHPLSLSTAAWQDVTFGRCLLLAASGTLQGPDGSRLATETVPQLHVLI